MASLAKPNKSMQNTTLKKSCKQIEPGFALVVTLVLMVLLAILALGLLSLSSVALRTASTEDAMREAQQNARLSVVMAIGRLQELAGPDTRVTANSTMLDPANPNVTGVWRSWEGSDRDASGKPIIPAYGQKLVTGDPTAAIAGTGDGRFLGWLASSLPTVAPDITVFDGVFTTEQTEAAGLSSVELVGDASTSRQEEQIHIRPTLTESSDGAYAWWVSGENQKAMVNTDSAPTPSGVGEWQKRIVANGRPDSEVFGLGDIETLPKQVELPTTESLSLVDAGARDAFHHVTAYSRGLLTNTATGGWRKDLSLFTENFSGMVDNGFPVFTAQPNNILVGAKATPGRPSNALLYPWADYRARGTDEAYAQVPPIVSWNALVDHALQYRNLSTSGPGSLKMPQTATTYNGAANRIGFQERVRRHPVLARLQWLYGLNTKIENTAKRGDPPKNRYRAGLVISPIITLWNPYNFEITFDNYQLRLQETSPLQLDIQIGSTIVKDLAISEIVAGRKVVTNTRASNYTRFRVGIPGQQTLKPGASRIYSLNTVDISPGAPGTRTDLTLQPGYQPNGGKVYFINDKAGNKVYGDKGDRFKVTRISYDATTTEVYSDGRVSRTDDGFGILFDFTEIPAGDYIGFGTNHMVYDQGDLGGTSVMDKLYPRISSSSGPLVEKIEGGSSELFASAILSTRVASPVPPGNQFDFMRTRGLLQTSPLQFYTELGFADHPDAKKNMAGTGVYHPVNAPINFTFLSLNGWTDPLAPQANPAGDSYIVTSTEAADGLTRCIIGNLPTQPLQSLGELQHLDARLNNPIPPFGFNYIGNSSAHPILEPNQVSITTQFNNGMSNDDSYLLNHVFFDDWFFSSVTTKYSELSRTVVKPRDQLFEDFVVGKDWLPNRNYILSPSVKVQNARSLATSATGVGPSADTNQFSYETMASKLSVKGMFNINSTSVEAWKAILRTNRDSEVPFINGAGGVERAATADAPFPRAALAGDESAGSGSTRSGNVGSAEVAGFRTFTNDQIDTLAALIVEEIKARGPFLSLSEFVNRRLTNVPAEKDLALAGTIQSALDEMAGMVGSANPYSDLIAMGKSTPSKVPGDPEYGFPEAALGSTLFGLPGWTRQADVLTPLAPILSARDDTFVIRGYGDARDKNDPNKIIARAWCEVIVERQPTFVDSAQDKTLTSYSSLLTGPVLEKAALTNRKYGRRFKIVGFQWLRAEEI